MAFKSPTPGSFSPERRGGQAACGGRGSDGWLIGEAGVCVCVLLILGWRG